MTYLRANVVINNINLLYLYSFKVFFLPLSRLHYINSVLKFYFIWETKHQVVLTKIGRSRSLFLNTKSRLALNTQLGVRYMYTLSSTFSRNSLKQHTITPLLVFSFNFWNFFNKFLWFSTYYYFNFMVTYHTSCLDLSRSVFCELISTNWSSQVLRYL